MKQYNPNKETRESMIGRDGGKIVLEIDENIIAPKYLENVVIEKHSPLQIGEEYYLVEEYSSHGDHSIGTVYYQLDYKDSEIDLQQIDYHYGWRNADQMQPHQSRLKFKVTNVEVKYLGDISLEEQIKLGILMSMNNDVKNSYALREDIASIYIFLITWEKIK